MRKLIHIMLLAGAMLSLLSCDRGGKVIPKDDFAKLYARMLLVDQWARENAPRRADTCLVYAPVLAEYCYDRDDYIASVNFYMADPEAFGKIFTKVERILQDRIDELTYVERRRAYLDSLRQLIEAKEFRRVEVMLDRCRDSVRCDSVSIVMDSTGVFVWERVPLDTVYYGPVWYVAPKDSVLLDSLANVADSIAAVRDSISTKAVSPEDGSFDGSNLKSRRPALETNMEKVVIQQVDSSRRRIPAAPRRRVSE